MFGRTQGSAFGQFAFGGIGDVVLAAVCIFLLFFRLGHNPLWDDEAVTALLAKGVLATGDTSAQVGQNVMAYGDGRELEQRGTRLRDHFQAPLQAYFMAPALGLLGDTAFAARLPFALAGSAVIGVLIFFVRGLKLAPGAQFCFSLLLATNVPLFLYLRQARYFSLATLAFALAVCLYYRLGVRAQSSTSEQRRLVLALGVVLSLFPLISAQFAATFLPLFVADYLIFPRTRLRLTPETFSYLLVPTLLTTSVVLLFWNPLGVSIGSPATLSDRLTLFGRTFRDLNAAHIGVGSLLLAAPLAAGFARQVWMFRVSLAVVLACVIEALIDPHLPELTNAQIRHLCPLIPLTLGLAAGVLAWVWNFSRTLAIPLLFAAAFTNALHWGALQPVRLRSIQYLWAKELLFPPADPYSAVLAALPRAADIEPGVAPATIAVDPGYMRYPLMFHAPQHVYTWQVSPTYVPLLPALDRRQVLGSLPPPDYLIQFGPKDDPLLGRATKLRPYTRIAYVPIYWRDYYRPEIIWHRFGGGEEEMTNPRIQGISIFKRVR